MASGVSLIWVVLGGEGGYGFDAWFGVSGEGAVTIRYGDLPAWLLVSLIPA